MAAGVATGATGGRPVGVVGGSGWIIAPGDGVAGAGCGAVGCGVPDGRVGVPAGGAGRGAGVGVGSPNPGGRIDSGRSCPIAGASATRAPAATAAASVALREVRKRHGLLDAALRTLGRAAGQQEQAADHDHKNDDDRDDETGHAT